MKYNKLTISTLFILILIGLISCESEYNKLIHNETTNGVINDSLIFNMKFGDSRKSFFDRCLQLNKQGLVFQGPNNKYAQYTLKSQKENGSSIDMLFYGIFDNNKIIGMDMLFSYPAWSPWDKTFTADNLVPIIKDSLQNWYPGNPFITLKLKEIDTKAYVKVDGNRQIIIYAKNGKDVVVKMEDLRNIYPSKFK